MRGEQTISASLPGAVGGLPVNTDAFVQTPADPKNPTR
jgi:hypothetical protein